MNRIAPIHPGEILKEEFLTPTVATDRFSSKPVTIFI